MNQFEGQLPQDQSEDEQLRAILPAHDASTEAPQAFVSPVYPESTDAPLDLALPIFQEDIECLITNAYKGDATAIERIVELSQKGSKNALDFLVQDAATKDSATCPIIVSLAEQGNAEAFGILYRAYSPIIFAFLIRNRRYSKEIAENLTQDTFVKAWRYYQSGGRTRSKFRAWIYKIAVNLANDFYASHENKEQPFSKLAETQPGNVREDMEEWIADRMIVQDFLRTLKPRDRRIVEMRIQGYSQEDTAADIDTSQGNVSSTMNRTKKKGREWGRQNLNDEEQGGQK